MKRLFTLMPVMAIMAFAAMSLAAPPATAGHFMTETEDVDLSYLLSVEIKSTVAFIDQATGVQNSGADEHKSGEAVLALTEGTRPLSVKGAENLSGSGSDSWAFIAEASTVKFKRLRKFI